MKKNNKLKRILAIIGIAAILSLYLISMIMAIFVSDKAPKLFLVSVFCTVVIPIMIYCFITVYEQVHKKDDTKDHIEENNTNDNSDTKS